MSTKKIRVRGDDPAVRAWLRQQEHESDQALAWLATPFRMFMCVSFIGTLLEVHVLGMALTPAVASAAGAGLAFAVAWIVLTHVFGADLPQMLIRSMLLSLFLGAWYLVNMLAGR
jgi:hypothetical protein